MSTKRNHAIEEICKNPHGAAVFQSQWPSGSPFRKKIFRGLCGQYFAPLLLFVFVRGDTLHTYTSKFRNVHMSASRGFDISRDLPLLLTYILNMALSNCFGIFDRISVCGIVPDPLTKISWYTKSTILQYLNTIFSKK